MGDFEFYLFSPSAKSSSRPSERVEDWVQLIPVRHPAAQPRVNVRF